MLKGKTEVADYRKEFIEACHELGIGDMTIEHRPVVKQPLKKRHWFMIYLALLGFQHQVKLIVADAIANDKGG